MAVEEAALIRSILYATDLGLYAPYVVQHALTLARSFKAELYVVHAVEPIGVLADSLLQTYVEPDQLKALRDQGLKSVLVNIEKRVMECFKEELDDGQEDLALIKTVRALMGDPPDVILKEATALNVDLIVIGTRSHGAEENAPIGRTAQRLLQTSRVPIYAVPLLQHR